MSREEIVRSVHRYNIVRSVLFFENKIICVLESMLPARGGISSRRRIWRKAKRHFSNAAGETKLPLPNRVSAAASLLPGKDAKKLRAPKKYRRTFWEKEEPT